MFDKTLSWLAWKVGSYISRHWPRVIWGALILSFTLAILFAILFLPIINSSSKWEYIGDAISLVFGAFGILSVLISLTVLFQLREMIIDYEDAGEKFEKIIMNAKQRLLILTENPAFLQVWNPNGLASWKKKLKDRMDQVHLEVVFLYIQRASLFKKYADWGKVVNKTEKELAEDLLTSHTFAMAKDTGYKSFIKLVQLSTDSLPFYIVIADENKMAMFCHSKVYPKVGNRAKKTDVRKSVMRGFLTYDQDVVSALRSVYLKFFQLHGTAVKYTCSECGKSTFKFDHHLLAHMDSINFAGVPEIQCELTIGCNGLMRGEPKELRSLDNTERNGLYKEIVGEEWPE